VRPQRPIVGEQFMLWPPCANVRSTVRQRHSRLAVDNALGNRHFGSIEFNDLKTEAEKYGPAVLANLRVVKEVWCGKYVRP
jgi:hypothetical protein